MKAIFFIMSGSILILFSGCKKNDVPGANTVWMKNMGFTPSSISIAANTTITWTNKDAVSHNVTSDLGWFSSNNIDPGSSFSQVCNTPGTFTYHCSIHPGEKGTVIVK